MLRLRSAVPSSAARTTASAPRHYVWVFDFSSPLEMSFHSAPIRLLCWPIQPINWIFSSPTSPCRGAEGLALAKRLRADQPDLPVLFMTGDDGHEDLASEHVLMKPFTGADLLRAIGRRIQGARHSETAAGGLLRRLKNPALVAAYLFWRAARNGGKPPRLSDLDWDRLPDAEHGFTVAVEPGEGSPSFRFLKVGWAPIARLGIQGTDVAAEIRPALMMRSWGR